MSRDQFSAWLQRHVIQIIRAVATASVAGGAATVELKNKADKAEVEQLRSLVNQKAPRDSVMDILRRVDERTGRVEKYLCRKSPNDLGC